MRTVTEYGEGRYSQPAKNMMRPPVVIAIGVCGLLAVGMLVKHFRGSSSEELTPSPRSSAAAASLTGSTRPTGTRVAGSHSRAPAGRWR